jgi:signal transduction histidine kinase
MSAEVLRILLVRPSQEESAFLGGFSRLGIELDLASVATLESAAGVVATGNLDAVVVRSPVTPPEIDNLLAVARDRTPPAVVVVVLADLPVEAEDALIGAGVSAILPEDRIDRLPSILRRERERARFAASLREMEQQRGSLRAQLAQAQKMEAIGTLAGGIAHDFNNILMGILGNTEMAREELDPWHPVHIHLTEILRATHRARDVVQRILTFSRNREPERQAISVGPILEDAAVLLRASLPSTIGLVVKREVDPPLIAADPGQLHLVVMNLVTNAAQAIGSNRGAIELRESVVDVGPELARKHVRLAERRYLQVTVADNGPGMGHDTIGRIFDPFFTTKPPGEGTGLGLAVVHGIVEEHDGAIVVDSGPGRGTAFHLYFPILERLTVPAAGPLSGIPRGSGEHVLLVDDEPAIVRIGRQMLERLGYRVTAVETAGQAFDTFSADPTGYDLVLSDLTMPGQTGSELAPRLRALNPSIGFVLTTGHPDALDRCPPDVDAVLSKPFATARLAQILDRILDARTARLGGDRG